jgi:ATP/maltotriose-dependent transcriptional regulator MalT
MKMLRMNAANRSKVLDLNNLRQVRDTANIQAPYARLSGRELEVLHLISQGYLSRDAGEILSLSRRTIDFHLGNVYYKLGVTNRIRAVSVARQYGLLPFEPHQDGTPRDFQ